jgi:hypothetical protein
VITIVVLVVLVVLVAVIAVIAIDPGIGIEVIVAPFVGLWLAARWLVRAVRRRMLRRATLADVRSADEAGWDAAAYRRARATTDAKHAELIDAARLGREQRLAYITSRRGGGSHPETMATLTAPLLPRRLPPPSPH